MDAIFTTTDALPTGLTLSEDGTIRGTCTDIGDGVFDITISVVSKDGSKTGTVSYKLDAISSTAQIATESLEDAVPGEFYSFALSADGGVQPYTWEVSALQRASSCTTAPSRAEDCPERTSWSRRFRNLPKVFMKSRSN